MKGLLWVFFEKIGLTILSLIATFWYANLLGPEGFGLSIIILSASLFLSAIVDNIQQFPLIAASDNIKQIFITSVIGWLVISLSISIMLLFTLVLIYGTQYWLIILLSVLHIPISSVSKAYVADLILKQKFKQLALRAFWGKIIGVFTGLILAYLGFVELAIIFQSFIALLIALFVMHNANPGLLRNHCHDRFNLNLFLRLVQEGIPSGVAVLEQSAKNHGLIIFLGIFVGPHISGLYALAIKFVDIPRTLIGYGFSTWATGKFHSVKNENIALLQVFNTAFLLSCSVLIPCYVGLIAVSEPLIKEFFGDAWLEASQIIIWLALYQCIFSLYLFLPPLQVLFKSTYNTLLVNFLSTVTILLSIVFFSDLLDKYSPLVGMYLSLLFILPKYGLELSKILSKGFGKTMKIITGIIVSSIGMYLSVLSSQLYFGVNNLYILIGVGIFSYIIIYLNLMLANIIDKKVLANVKVL